MSDLSWKGHTFLKDAKGQSLDNAISVDVGAGKVRAEIRLVAGNDDSPEVIETQSLQVAHHYRKLDAALRAKQYRNRRITTHFKPQRSDDREPDAQPPIGMVACPHCQELGEVDAFCEICDGEGTVSRRRKDEGD